MNIQSKTVTIVLIGAVDQFFPSVSYPQFFLSLEFLYLEQQDGLVFCDTALKQRKQTSALGTLKQNSEYLRGC